MDLSELYQTYPTIPFAMTVLENTDRWNTIRKRAESKNLDDLIRDVQMVLIESAMEDGWDAITVAGLMSAVEDTHKPEFRTYFAGRLGML